jgi:hypothetical protein
VRHRRASVRDLRPPSYRGGGEVGLEKPTLERARRGDEITQVLLHQPDADHLGAPGGVLAAEPEGGFRDLPVQDGVGVSQGIVGGDAVAAPEAKSPDQTSDGHAR